jgi:hypothetical protein
MTAIRNAAPHVLTLGALVLFTAMSASAGASLRLTALNGCQGELVCEIPWLPEESFVDFTRDDRCRNDQARSMLLSYVPEGTRIEVFGSPSATGDRGRTLITVNVMESTCIHSFDAPVESGAVLVDPAGGRRLDGKVSSIKIIPPQ